MSTPTRTDVTVERHGRHLQIDAAFIAALLRSTVAEAWDKDRREEFAEFVCAEARAKTSAERDNAHAFGPPEVSEETERLTGEADERWEALDVSGAAWVSLAEARRLHELLGRALEQESGYVGRLIPAARAA